MNKKAPLPITAFIGGSVIQPPNALSGFVGSSMQTTSTNNNNNNNNNNKSISKVTTVKGTGKGTALKSINKSGTTRRGKRAAASMCFSSIPAKTDKSRDHHTTSTGNSSSSLSTSSSSSTTTNNNGLCCCHKAPKSYCASAIGVLLLVLLYTAMGSIIFMTLEGELDDNNSLETAVAASKPYPRTELANAEIRSRTVDRLWSITEDLNILYKENWTRLAAQEVQLFQDTLLRSVRQSKMYYQGGGSGSGSGSGGGGGGGAVVGGLQMNPSTHKWTYASTFLYSLTLITTIGYGGVSPRTQWGRIAALVYALFGIPIVLLYLSAMGEGLSAGMRCLFRRARSKQSNLTNNNSSGGSSSSTSNSSIINSNNTATNASKKLHGDLNKSCSSSAASANKHYQHHHHQQQQQQQHQQQQQQQQHVDLKLNSTLNHSYGTLTKLPYNHHTHHHYHHNNNHNNNSRNQGTVTGISSSPGVPISICIMVMISYMTAGALLFHKIQNWTVLEALYFCFTSLGTIGFGELAPTGNLSLYLAAAYILIGMAIVAMCFSLIQTELVMWLRKFAVQEHDATAQMMTEDVALVSVAVTPKSS